jgi:TRAP-type C4-dicarboxylate transport system substrate-binding protein
MLSRCIRPIQRSPALAAIEAQLEALQSGKLDLAVVPLVFGAKKIPEFSLALLPGLIPNLATARALKGSEVHAKLQEIAAANGLRIVTWWWMRGMFPMVGQPRA